MHRSIKTVLFDKEKGLSSTIGENAINFSAYLTKIVRQTHYLH